MKKTIIGGAGMILLASHLSTMQLGTDFPPEIPKLIEPELLVHGDPKSGRELRRERRKSNRKKK